MLRSQNHPHAHRVLLDDLSWEDSEGGLEFRLTYDGLLLSANSRKDAKDTRIKFKQEVRRRFHFQMKRLWQTVPYLRTGELGGPDIGGYVEMDRPKINVDEIAKAHSHFGFNFVPLVTKELSLSCWIDVLYLRRQEPGGIIDHWDIDNRLKTLFDCLQIPDAAQGYSDIVPADDEQPYYVLLENDRLISKISVETDGLLEDLPGRKPDQNDARLVITVRLKPYETHFGN